MIHNCPSCSYAEVWFEKNRSDVYLNLNKVATAVDLEKDHFLEYEGQTIETIKIQIAYCPYCGQKLASDNAIFEPQFQYHNFT